jgi:tRNA G18 (ribose-2'-O)-methylase SpoU
VPIEAIHDANDPRLAEYRNLPDAGLLEGQRFIAEGRLIVRRLLQTPRYRTRSLMVTTTALAAVRDLLDDAPAVPVYVVSQAVMNTVAGFDVHRGCLAAGDRGVPDTLAALAGTASRLAVLERIANADNVGSVFRNAAAFAIDGVILDPASTDPLYRKAIRTSAGCVLQVPFARGDSWPDALRQLQAAGFQLVALTPQPGAMPVRDAAAQLRGQRFALLLGHEGEGLSDAALELADLRVRIPISPAVDSLNVAAASAIAFHELS